MLWSLIFKVFDHFLKAKSHSGKIRFQDNGIGQGSADTTFEFPGYPEIIQVFFNYSPSLDNFNSKLS